MVRTTVRTGILAGLVLLPRLIAAQSVGSTVTIDLNDTMGPMNIDSVGMGDSTNSPAVDWSDRVGEISVLQPRLIRFFVVDFFNVLPSRGQYQFEKLDPWIDTILKTGAKPLLCIGLKPRHLFPSTDVHVTDPADYQQWEEFIYQVVLHYKTRNGGGWYWEIGNEVNTPTGGGTPYNFTQEGYIRWYEHTAKAILKADPEAQIGGPALSGYTSTILPALLDRCENDKIPINFVSWHIYTNRPTDYSRSAAFINAILARHQGMHVAKVIDEWGGNLQSAQNGRFATAVIAESIYQMKESGIDASCYFQIRDYPVDAKAYNDFMPPELAVRAIRWFNRTPAFDGLFDFENRVQPNYYVFKMAAQLTGTRIRVDSKSASVHALATSDETLGVYSIMLWNFSAYPVEISLQIRNLPTDVTATRVLLEGLGVNDTARLSPVPVTAMKRGNNQVSFRLKPWGVTSITLGKPMP